jgi:tetratricopeptide (TPR) repeat protein
LTARRDAHTVEIFTMTTAGGRSNRDDGSNPQEQPTGVADNQTVRRDHGPGPGHPARIGPFRLIALIGEGGMGMVYEAEQDRPQRLVALKIVRPGMVPASALRRFELEYEFLGRLQHPGIAQIYQAGVEDMEYGPQPYFAMELVRGRRLDVYVRAKAPGLRERLELVAAIADAVQHAHHRGIIHRDLKPANILVTDAGEPKVLDFGIARAAHDGVLTTMHTAAGEVLGTLSYMSPEQIAGDVTSVDTRSDVYALGVILYEVLAERPPYELDRKSLAEAARIISDTEPTRLSLATRAVPHDVETIVAKALEKEKERRYNSAADLAEDIRRFLRDEPITARPPSAAYQVRKFARRHKALVGGAIASLLVLLIGVVATSWQAVRATRAERTAEARAREAESERAKAEAVTAFVTEMLESVDPSEAQGREVSVRQALDQAAAKVDAGAMKSQPAVEGAVRNTIGLTYGGLGLFDQAEKQLRAAEALHERTGAGPLERGDTQNRLVNVLYQAGKYDEAIKAAERALSYRRQALGTTHKLVATSLDDLGAVLMAKGDMARAEPLMRESLAMRRALLPAGDPLIAVGLNNLAYLIWRKGNLEEAEAMYREALAIDRKALGNNHPEVASRLINLVVLLGELGRRDEAEPLAREAVEMRRRVLGPRHPAMANTLDAYSGVLEDLGRDAEAEANLREALAIARAAFGEVHIETAREQHHLAVLLWKQGKYREAEPYFQAAVTAMLKTHGPTHRITRSAIVNHANNQLALGNVRAAEATARDALARYRQAPNDRLVAGALLALSHALIAQQRREEAILLLREALERLDPATERRRQWWKGEIQSTLGAALAADPGRREEGERLMTAGYEALQAHPSTPRTLLRAAIERLATHYASSGRPAEAAAWRARLTSRT